MLKNKTKIISIFLLLTILFSAISIVYANNESGEYDIMLLDSNEDGLSTNETNLPNNSNQVTNLKSGDEYLVGENVTIDYTVDGNVFIFADTVTISEQIGGDAFIIANKIIIDNKGYIYSNLFALAKSVEISGIVYDAYVCAQDFTISGGYVYRDLRLTSKTFNNFGVVGRNAYVDCSSMDFELDDTTGIIYGNLEYSSKSEINLPESAVSGETKFTKNITTEISTSHLIYNYIISLGSFIIFVLVVWLLCLWLAPKFLNNSNKLVGKKTLYVSGLGVLTLIAIPIICIILIFLNLTANISLVLLALYILAIVISRVLFTIVANNFICSKLKFDKNIARFAILIITSIIVYIISNLPYIGWLLSLIITILGLGILIYSILPKKENDISDNSEQ